MVMLCCLTRWRGNGRDGVGTGLFHSPLSPSVLASCIESDKWKPLLATVVPTLGHRRIRRRRYVFRRIRCRRRYWRCCCYRNAPHGYTANLKHGNAVILYTKTDGSIMQTRPTSLVHVPTPLSTNLYTCCYTLHQLFKSLLHMSHQPSVPITRTDNNKRKIINFPQYI